MARNTSVYLGDHFAQFIEEQVRSGRYSSASDVIRAGLRHLEAEEAQLAALRRGIQKAEEEYQAGRVHEVDDDFWEDLHQEVDNRLAQDKTSAADV